MYKIVNQAKNQLNSCILCAMEKAAHSGSLPSGEIPQYNIEVPANSDNGDYSTNVALSGAKTFRMAPRKIAEAIGENLDLSGTMFDSFQIAGAGFINFFLGSKFYGSIVEDVLTQGDNYGKSEYGKGKKCLVEFVSANPTGPMHVGNARGGAIGDCLASVLTWAGFDTQREFYINDAGNQIEKFATSLEVRYLQLYKDNIEMPEDAYQGEDILVHAKAFAEINGNNFVQCDSETRRTALVDFALPINIAGLKSDLLKYRIEYDCWFRESTLHRDGSVEMVIQKMKDSGHTYLLEDALWFKATDFGADKDFVLVRSNGIPTYIVPDIAYHYNKLIVRGYDKAIDVLGADHHGYMPRMKAALTALGIDPDRLDFVIMQMVRLVRDGEIIKASKRSGKAITLVTLLEEVPIDAARFFFNLREANSHFDFDLDLAAQETSQNPVYYVQYAHARICSILRKVENDGVKISTPGALDLELLTAPEEKQLIRHLASLEDEIILSAKTYDPAKITHYVVELATLFHKFYNACRVACDDEKLMMSRISLCVSVKNTIKNILTMFRISTPNSM